MQRLVSGGLVIAFIFLLPEACLHAPLPIVAKDRTKGLSGLTPGRYFCLERKCLQESLPRGQVFSCQVCPLRSPFSTEGILHSPTISVKDSLSPCDISSLALYCECWSCPSISYMRKERSRVKPSNSSLHVPLISRDCTIQLRPRPLASFPGTDGRQHVALTPL